MKTIDPYRIHFAFVDGEHQEKSVKTEIKFIQKRQQCGDMMLFDDCSQTLYPGVAAAINSMDGYTFDIISITDTNLMVLATKL